MNTQSGTTRFIMYLRKSTESEDRQALSIPAQERELLALAERNGLTIVGAPMTESMSAKRPGRPVFDDMMRQLERRRASGILCWHLDRLARNPKDGGAIIWATGEGYIREIVTPSATYRGTPDDKLMMTLIFGMSAKYVDDLSRNVKRGYEQALHQGRWPGATKVGYMRDPETHLTVPDPERFQVVADLWRLRLQGTPIKDILREAQARGLTTRQRRRIGGRPIAYSSIYRLFQDPFYAGVMRYCGQDYPGIHQAIITWSEFERSQKMFAEAIENPAPQSSSMLDFTYRGIFRCGNCSAAVTAERKTNRFGSQYIYYHCCRKHNPYRFCAEGYVEERAVERDLLSLLDEIQIPERVAHAALGAVERELGRRQTERVQRLKDYSAQSANVLSRRKRLEDLLVDGLLERERFTERANELSAELMRIDEARARLERPADVLEPWREAFSLACNAKSRFIEATPSDRRNILRKLFSNLIIKDRKVLGTAKKVFLELRQRGLKSHVLTNWDAVCNPETWISNDVVEQPQAILPRE